MSKTKKAAKKKAKKAKPRSSAKKTRLIPIEEKPNVKKQLTEMLNAGEKLKLREVAKLLNVSYSAVWQVVKKWHRDGLVDRTLSTEEGGPVTFLYHLKQGA